MGCTCFIVPKEVLERIERDPDLPTEVRDASARTQQLSSHMRKVRTQSAELTRSATALGGAAPVLAAAPAITVYDCRHTHALPGTPAPNAGASMDQTAMRTSVQTSSLANFYKKAFDRNSTDGGGMTMMSSIHYGVKFNNAMWNGSQMVYGDGDGAIFVDFTLGSDVIGHELTHGVTQHSLQLDYTDEAGGLNESVSDCFGSMFRQWMADQDALAADWLIGNDVLGAVAKAKGFTCLRNLANPADPNALAPQPASYAQVKPGMDPHVSSGPPNLAFCTACKTLGGRSWEGVGQVWYRALTGFGASPHMKMKDFAGRTRQVAQQMFGGAPAVASAVDRGWKLVGL